MRLVFLGTPQAAVRPARTRRGHHDVALVITRPDRRRGRGGALTPSPVKIAAEELGLRWFTVWTTSTASTSNAAWSSLRSDGQCVLLERVPMLNVHFSLLPRWRGAAPVQRAILAVTW